MNVTPKAAAMRYRAFISYSHADEAWARWLMRRLETYRVPSRLVGAPGIDGPVPARLGAFFRDRDELTASGDLAATIRAALSDSAALIVVCSPAAAASRWVGAEVQAFRDSGRGNRILAFVVEGEPGQAAGEHACFPPPLIAPGEDGQPVEPLAADARSTADGRERAFIRLVAGLLGIGYDQLAQREAHRKQRRLLQVAVASLAGMTLALGLAATAYVARNDAQRRQAQAEDILGFMLGDLREKLTTVGRLDLMRAVDDKAAGYFAALDPRDLSDRALEEQARSLSGIGQVRLDEGNHNEAMKAFREAHERSTALLERQPENGQRLFDLAQAEYWIGYVALRQGNYDAAESWLRKYRDSAARLVALDPGNFDWQRELGYGHYNLAVLDERRGRYTTAEATMLTGLALLRDWLKQRPDDLQLRDEAADLESWLGSLALWQGQLQKAETYFAEQLQAVRVNIAKDPKNTKWQQSFVVASLLMLEAQGQRGRIREARETLARMAPLAAALHAQDPSNNMWRLSLGRSHWWRAQLDAATDRASATSAATAAADMLAQAHSAAKEDQNIAAWLLRARTLQARLAMDAGDTTAAARNLTDAKRLTDAALQAAPTEKLRPWLAERLLLQGDLEARRGNAANATRAWSEARRLLRQVAEDAGGTRLHANAAHIAFARLDPLLRAERALGRHDEAARIRQRLEAAGYVPLQPFPAAAATLVAAR
ncbi:MAG: TIR domain-containing protein [Pseudomonadota bacterium]